MIAELLEKFEDVFQPYSPKEVEKRWPEWHIIFVSLHQGKGKTIKSVNVKAPARGQDFAIIRAVKSLGVPLNRIHFVSTFSQEIEFKSKDNIKDDYFKPMIGIHNIVWSYEGII